MSYKRGKQKSSRLSFHLSSCPASCSAAPQGESDYLLPCFVRMITFVTSICSTRQDTPGRGTAICSHLSQARTQTVPMAKKAASFARATGKHIYRQNFLKGLKGRTIQFQETRDSHLLCLTQTQLCGGLQLRLRPHERNQITFLFQPLWQLGHWWHQWPLWCLQGTSRGYQPTGRSHL